MIRKNISLFGVTFALLALLSAFSIIKVRTRSEGAAPSVSVDVEGIPLKLGDWSGESAGLLGAMELNVLRLDRYIKRNYSRASDNASVYLYLGYWSKQTGDYQAAKHSPLVCFPSNGWRIYDIESVSVPQPSGNPALPSARLIGEVNGETYVTYFWFFTGERIYTQDYQAMLLSSLETLLSGRSDGGIVELVAPIRKDLPRVEAVKFAQSQIEDLLREFGPAYRKAVHLD